MFREQPRSESMALEDLLLAQDPAEFRKQLAASLEERRDSEGGLVALLELLREQEHEINALLSPGGENRPHLLKDIEEIRAAYNSAVRIRTRSRPSFAAYLYEYLRNLIKPFAERSAKYQEVKQKALQQEESERARQEALSRAREEEAEIAKLVPVIRQEILTEMEQRTQHFNHSPEDQAEISDVDKKNKIKYGRSNKEDIENERLLREREYLLGALMERFGMFGHDTRIYHTDVYDDYVRRTDLAVVAKDGPTMFVDITHDPESIGKKFYYNQENPVRILKYPPDPSLRDERGIPIVIGMTQADAEESIQQFLESEARARLGLQPEEKDEQVYQESFGRWMAYVLRQLKHQQNYILEHAQAISDEDLLADYNAAFKNYEEAIKYFEELKKERYPFMQLNERRPWDQRMMSISSAIRDYEQREGLEEYPPSLPELARAA